MAITSTLMPTLADWAKRTDPSGRIDTIVELLAQTNEILDDMVWVEGNLPTGHRTTVRTGLPTPAWRKLNYGVQPSKSTTVQVTDGCGMLESYAEVDKALADLNGSSGDFRVSEDRAFIEAMNRAMAETVFYGDTAVTPERFLGLSPRFNDLSAESGGNILDANGSGADNTSVWLVAWSPSTVHGIFPKASTAGLQHRDLGEVTLEDAQGGRYQGYRTHYKWDCGLTLRDWRYAVRIANIDVSDLETGSAANLIDLMTDAIERLPTLAFGRPAFYMHRRVQTALRKQIRDKTNVQLSLDDVAGRKVVTFDGIPVRRCDALSLTEAPVA